jgi:hypothetical protein
MKAKLLLRIASVLIFLHVLGHTIGHSGWRHADDPQKQAVIDSMTGKTFPFMGAEKSMGDYYEGYGYASTVSLLFFAFVLWAASSSGANKFTINTLAVLAVCLLLWGILELIYFFPFAAAFSLLAGLLTLIAAIQLRKQNTGQTV